VPAKNPAPRTIPTLRGKSSVSWGLDEKIIWAWVFTLPTTAAMGGAFYFVLHLLNG
jgi:PiT family inorganic phosphate transporter